jgi:hypothetical protein
MPKRLNTVLGLTKKELKDKRVSDSMIDFDSQLHMDSVAGRLQEWKIKFKLQHA